MRETAGPLSRAALPRGTHRVGACAGIFYPLSYRNLELGGDDARASDFLLSPKRDLIAAKGFLQPALEQVGHRRPRVINVGGHPAYPPAIEQLKRSGELGQRCRCRRAPYLNNILEQDHRFVKQRVVPSQGFRSVEGALNTIPGYEAMNIIRKAQIRWVAKSDVLGQIRFIEYTLDIAA